MNAEILNEPPLSGLYEEIKVNIKDRSTFVLFEDSEYIDFCGIFGGGSTPYSEVVRNGNIAFIVSFGQGYIFDIDKREVLHTTGSEYIQHMIYTGYENLILCHDNIELFVYNNELLWSSGCVSADGIIINGVKDTVVEGKLNAFTEWEDFTLNLTNFNFDCNWIYGLDND